MTIPPRRLLRFLPVGLALAALLLPGCEKEEITTYTVPRSTVRLLAVIVPHTDATWFFRMSAGSTRSPKTKDFDEFIGSVQLTARTKTKTRSPDRSRRVEEGTAPSE